ncbi:4-alpha-glucanotransferase [Candidatus Chlamydia sanziniae]|uniref:4-alpha-glucanotransferase n=1 Tax=Candidatus Chlamydia sanziniae TaxID=1806891 RepID=A0A1A9HVN3_9CHLA|nr:4-alpha-glucanotransferase [Candidatus Chlamydia sanziniae]ANH79070.1 4-alpha-glucanotransferase [Candidatus Chlamydia sanziniae]
MNILPDINNSPTARLWQSIGISTKHGVCVPLFSLHTQESCGIGEFLDLLPFITWCKQLGFHIIQLLPLNDTGEDTSPYNSISSVALNPLFLSLRKLPHVMAVPQAHQKLQEMHKLCHLSSVNYTQVKASKWMFLKEYYQHHGYKESKENNEFLAFIERESYWLMPYGVFRAIKYHMKGAPINNWPKPLTDIHNFSYLEKQFQEEMLFFAYLQFLCYRQMNEVKAWADKHNILLQGDLPILISKDSCDVWYFRQYFSSSQSVGAPPDIYNAEGQNWHLPIYNFTNLIQDHYIWWKERLRYAENFYSLYRLDHIVGFFRFWVWDPSGNGKFIPEHPEDYIKQGKEILSTLIHASSMLPIGEDLGDVPQKVKQTLQKLGICGIRIPRWERNWRGNEEFIPLENYSPLSVTSLSTHDSDTLALWWQDAPKEAQQFAEFLGLPFTRHLSQENQKNILKLSHQSGSIFHINLFNDYLALCPDLVSKNLYHERINSPGTISKNNWVYRVRPSIEQFSTHEKLNIYIEEILPKP